MVFCHTASTSKIILQQIWEDIKNGDFFLANVFGVADKNLFEAKGLAAFVGVLTLSCLLFIV